MKSENINQVLTEGEIALVSQIKHLELGNKLSVEGAIKWNNYNSDNQIQQLISMDIQEIQDDPTFKSALKKIDELSAVEPAEYDVVV